eukprot:Nk52_evm12s2531 gene=Nk52_evmTU12s2531
MIGADGNAVKCRCNQPAREVTVVKDGKNKGRKFLGCNRGNVLGKCNFFQWADTLRTEGVHNAMNRVNSGGNGYQKKNASSSFSVHDTDRIYVSYNSPTVLEVDAKYSESLNALYKEIPGYEFNRDVKKWTFPKSSYSLLVETLQDFKKKANVDLSTIPRFVEQLLSKPSIREFNDQQVEEKVRERLPDDLVDKLKGYQLECVKIAVNANGRLLIGDEMGLGKTVEALSIAKYYQCDWPLLVLCPGSLRLTWSCEIQKWLDIDEDDIQVVMTGKTPISQSHQIVIFPYSLLMKYIAEDFAHFTCIVADECHFLKSKDAKRTKMALPILNRSKRAVLLSGTPSISRPIELHTLIQAVMRTNVLGSHTAYAMRYCRAVQTAYGWDTNGNSCLAELNLILNHCMMVRRLKEDVLTELPEKVRQCIQVSVLSKFKDSCTRKKKAISKEGALSARDFTEMGGGGGFDNRRKMITELYKEAGEAKIPEVKAYLEVLMETRDQKVIVFAHHHEVIDAITEHLDAKNCEYISITGKTDAGKRQAMCDRFQEQPNCRFAVLGIKAAGVGLTLTAASVVVFAELWWNAGDLVQAEDRAHRIGQRSCVNVKYILGKGTFDMSMWDIIQRKIDVVGQSVDGKKAGTSMKASKTSSEEVNSTQTILSTPSMNAGERFTSHAQTEKIPRKRTWNEASGDSTTTPRQTVSPLRKMPLSMSKATESVSRIDSSPTKPYSFSLWTDKNNAETIDMTSNSPLSSPLSSSIVTPSSSAKKPPADTEVICLDSSDDESLPSTIKGNTGTTYKSNSPFKSENRPEMSQGKSHYSTSTFGGDIDHIESNTSYGGMAAVTPPLTNPSSTYAPTFGATPSGAKKYDCPICAQKFEWLEIDSHVDECLTKNG